jgi:di/tricarboxylate transporter
MLIVFGVLAVAIGLFAWGRPRADIVGIIVVLALMSSRVLTPQEALAGFGSPVVILIAAIFIVSEAMVNTGVAQRLGDAVVKAGGGNETRLVALIMVLAGVVGAVMNSSAIAAMLIPVVLTIANKTRLNRKRLLMPLCIAVMISGMMMLISSSPNMIIENILRERGLTPLSFFSWAPFGLTTLAISIPFMLLAGRDLLSKQLIAENAETNSRSAHDIVSSYDLRDRWHRLRVSAGSPLIDRSVAQMQQPLYDQFGLILIGFEKHPDGKTQFLPALPETVFETDDIITILAGEEQMQQLVETLQCRVAPLADERHRQAALQDMGIAEVMLAPESKLIGNTLSQIDLHSNYRLSQMPPWL